MRDEWSAWQRHYSAHTRCAARDGELGDACRLDGAHADVLTESGGEVARFGVDDHPALVEAACCCQFCLRRCDLIVIDERAERPRGWALCARCEADTQVWLTDDQVLRLVYAPPRSIEVRILGHCSQ